MMKRIASIAVATALLLPGCYLGRAPERRTLAIITNTAFVGVGAAGIASANGDEVQIATMISAVPLIAGLAGLAINLAVSSPSAPSRSAPPPPPPGLY